MSEIVNFIDLVDSMLIFLYVGLVFLLVYKECKTRVLDLILALFISGALSEGIKYFINKPRPTSSVFFDTQKVFEGSSFPSTHTTIAFTAFFFYILACHSLTKKKSGGGSQNLHKNIMGESKYENVIVFLLFFGALLVGVLRVSVGAHFPIDVFAGILLGLVCALPFRYYDVAARRFK